MKLLANLTNELTRLGLADALEKRAKKEKGFILNKDGSKGDGLRGTEWHIIAYTVMGFRQMIAISIIDEGLIRFLTAAIYWVNPKGVRTEVTSVAKVILYQEQNLTEVERTSFLDAVDNAMKLIVPVREVSRKNDKKIHNILRSAAIKNPEKRPEEIFNLVVSEIKEILKGEEADLTPTLMEYFQEKVIKDELAQIRLARRMANKVKL